MVSPQGKPSTVPWGAVWNGGSSSEVVGQGGGKTQKNEVYESLRAACLSQSMAPRDQQPLPASKQKTAEQVPIAV